MLRETKNRSISCLANPAGTQEGKFSSPRSQISWEGVSDIGDSGGNPLICLTDVGAVNAAKTVE